MVCIAELLKLDQRGVGGCSACSDCFSDRRGCQSEESRPTLIASLFSNCENSLGDGIVYIQDIKLRKLRYLVKIARRKKWLSLFTTNRSKRENSDREMALWWASAQSFMTIVSLVTTMFRSTGRLAWLTSTGLLNSFTWHVSRNPISRSPVLLCPM